MNALSIRQRLLLLIALASISIVLVAGVTLLNKKHGMLEERQLQIKVLVETAYTLVESFAEQARQGQLSSEEAQQRALQALDAMRYGDNGYFMVYSFDSEMVHHPIAKQLIGKDLNDLKDVNGVHIVRDAVNAARQGGGWVDYYWPKAGEDKTPYHKVSYSLSFNEWGWVLNTGLYVDDVERSFWHDVIWLLLGVAMLTGGLIGFSLVIAASIVRPLRYLSNSLSQAENDLDLSLRYPQDGRNEIARVGVALNNLMNAFSQTLSGIHSGVKQLDDQADKLAGLSSHIVQASNRQSDDTNTIAALVEQFTQSINVISDDASKMTDLSNQNGEEAESGSKSMHQTLVDMQQIHQSAKASSEAITELGKHSKEIEGVVKVINDVAEQTNLLALNAAIEAARAGDQGRGFAVVAEQVRALAERTSESTKQIAQTIRYVHEGIDKTVTHINNSMGFVEQNMQQTEQVEQKVSHMRQLSEQLVAIIREVTHSLQEQTSANMELADRVSQITAMAMNNHQSAAEVQDTAQQVNTLVDDFSSSVARFKLF
ncbi:methyl-accepting chemotaxis protein [Aliagarivorans taiwanensis]|uniref:methyl-accepting chemotaxis protein n=1 Tax=Aliagarivorans taiwanensis TaxID=561966 RepID=UPI0004081795|nr:methyl-accepting chemotaxis protein [Aliagarivorans taiwanensis]